MATQTCWNYWLQLKDEYCPHMKDLSNLAPEIKFLGVLAATWHAVLMKVQIDEKIYALKLYRLMTPHWHRKTFKYHAITSDPFFGECQAYSILTGDDLNGKIGATCYGWLTISKDQENRVIRMMYREGKYFAREHSYKEVVLDDWHRRADTASEPVRGLLLEYIDGYNLDQVPSPPVNAQSLREKLAKLHSLDIVHADFKASNIMVTKDGEGVLIDFGSAEIWPNVRISRERFDAWKTQEANRLEYYMFRLQSLKCFQGVKLTSATSAEEALQYPESVFVRAEFQPGEACV
ncbi:hypothetical protein FQN50_003773 [Emmonsiellopsis sp. PD_5]|nr:hypothetical protein FQN50_003773 [Emmonsiellopsis sp. PD_5]